MPESQLSYVVDGQTVRGSWHAPATAGEAAPAVLWLHGFAAHRNEAHRLFVDGARRLAERGVASLRIDFRGCGESDGDFSEVSIRRMVADARGALAAIAAHPGVDASRLGVVGMSLGAAIASQLAGEAGVAAMAFWSPVVFPVPIFARLGLYAAHPELARQGYIDWNGYKVGGGLLGELAALDPLGALAGYDRPLYVLSGGEDLVATSENAQALLAELATAEGETLHHAGHIFASVSDRAWLLDRTERWLAERLSLNGERELLSPSAQ